MNDETSAQLSSTWRIPTYAQNHLWVEGIGGATRAEGEHGLFELSTSTPQVTVYWHDVHTGAALTCLPWQADSLDWDGRVHIGGYVDAMHLMELPQAEFTVNVLYLGGQPLKPEVLPYPDAAHRGAITPPDFHACLVSEVKETYSTWLVPEDSPLSQVAQDAMMNNLRLHCFGHLADDASGWGNLFGLPIVLEAVTIFGP